MDKKSALKCLYALERAQFLHVFEKMVVEENSSHKVCFELIIIYSRV